MTYEEAKQKAIDAFVAAGLSVEEATAKVTPQDIKFYGWAPSSPTLDCDTSVAIDQATLNDHRAVAMAEAKSNQVLANSIEFLFKAGTKLLGGGAALLLVSMMLLGGCSSDAGRQVAADAEISLTKYVNQRDNFDAKLIDDKTSKNLEIATQNYEAAVASHTSMITIKEQVPVKVRTVAADGKVTETTEMQTVDRQVPTIDPRIMTALQLEKGKQFAAVTGVAAGEYAQIAQMNINAANAASSIRTLQEYLGEQAKTQMSVSQGLEYANTLLDTFLQSKKKTSAP
jgi:hypothetical protein